MSLLTAWRRLVRHLVGEGPDPAWAPTRLRYTTPRTYDYDAARAAAAKAKKTSPSGRPLRVKTKAATKTRPKVVRLTKRA